MVKKDNKKVKKDNKKVRKYKMVKKNGFRGGKRRLNKLKKLFNTYSSKAMVVAKDENFKKGLSIAVTKTKELAKNENVRNTIKTSGMKVIKKVKKKKEKPYYLIGPNGPMDYPTQQIPMDLMVI